MNNCTLCGGQLYELGQLGDLMHMRCRQCGMQHSTPVEEFDCKYGHFGCSTSTNGPCGDEEARGEGATT